MDANPDRSAIDSFRLPGEVSALAPNPGQPLGTITYSDQAETVYLRMLEGAPRDAISFRGIATDFEAVRIINFHVRGDYINVLEDVPTRPSARAITIEYGDIVSNHPNRSSLTKATATVIYTWLSPDGRLDPDGAVINLDFNPGAKPRDVVPVFVSEMRRGFEPLTIIGGAIIAVFAGTKYLYYRLKHLPADESAARQSGTSRSGTSRSGTAQSGASQSVAPPAISASSPNYVQLQFNLAADRLYRADTEVHFGAGPATIASPREIR